MSSQRQRIFRRQRGEIEILLDRQSAEDAPLLGNQLQSAAGDRVARQQLDRLALETDAAGARMQDAGQRFQRRALAGAVAAEQRDDFALAHLHRDVEQNVRVAVIGC